MLWPVLGLVHRLCAVPTAYSPTGQFLPSAPFGLIPCALAGSMVRVVDTTLLALVPLLLGLFLGYVPGMLAQAGFSAACVLVLMYSDWKE